MRETEINRNRSIENIITIAHKFNIVNVIIV